MIDFSAAANASQSLLSNKSPCSRSLIIDRYPSILEATTGLREAIAYNKTIPKLSDPVAGEQNISEDEYYFGRSSYDTRTTIKISSELDAPNIC